MTTMTEPTIAGEQDKRQFIRCTSCKQLRHCYRGPLTKVVETEAGPFEHWMWLCETCFAAIVGEALRDHDSA